MNTLIDTVVQDGQKMSNGNFDLPNTLSVEKTFPSSHVTFQPPQQVILFAKHSIVTCPFSFAYNVPLYFLFCTLVFPVLTFPTLHPTLPGLLCLTKIQILPMLPLLTLPLPSHSSANVSYLTVCSRRASLHLVWSNMQQMLTKQILIE